jgi:hypothetical protein
MILFLMLHGPIRTKLELLLNDPIRTSIQRLLPGRSNTAAPHSLLLNRNPFPLSTNHGYPLLYNLEALTKEILHRATKIYKD